MKMLNKWGLVTMVFAVMACSSGPKRVNYSATTSPNEVMQTLEADVQEGYTKQVDVLARDDFSAGQKAMDKARGQIKDGASQDKVLRSLGEARAYVDRANAMANGRRSTVEGVLTARQAALDAGSRNYPKQREALAAIDDDLRDASMNKSISPADFSKLQSRYMDLELASIQSKHLDAARGRIEGSKQKNAKNYTPRTLNRAELDLRNAENMISSHRHEDQVFAAAVDKANASSELLSALAEKVRSGKAVLPEDVALKLVYQERGLKNMNEKLSAIESQTEKTSEKLSAQDQELKKARETQALERALAQARKEFSREEADVYRDGSKLLIRLKSMNFASGRSDLPADSMPLLSKVKTVAEELGSSQIVVEGHTDSLGSAQVNDPLSQKRAEAVAQYLGSNGVDADKIEAVGHGFKKPIAGNKSKAGRSQNRRVDVIITPGDVETATTSM